MAPHPSIGRDPHSARPRRSPAGWAAALACIACLAPSTAGGQEVVKVTPQEARLESTGGRIRFVLAGKQLELFQAARVVDGRGSSVAACRSQIAVSRDGSAGLTVDCGALAPGTYMPVLLAQRVRTPVRVDARIVVERAEPAPPRIAELDVTGQSLRKGESTRIGILLSAVAQADLEVRLAASRNGVLKMPGTVVLRRGTDRTQVDVLVAEAPEDMTVEITATADGASKAGGKLAIQGPPILAAFDLLGATSGGMVWTDRLGDDVATGRIELDRPAPAGGSSVSLDTPSSGLVSLPAAATVAPGQSTADFSLGTSALVSSDQTVPVRATLGAVTLEDHLLVKPPALPVPLAATWRKDGQLLSGPNSAYGGDTVTATVELSAPTPPDGMDVVVQLSRNVDGMLVAGQPFFSPPQHVPGNVGSFTVEVATSPSMASGPVTMTVQGWGRPEVLESTFQLLELPTALESVALDRTSAMAGDTLRATVRFQAASPADRLMAVGATREGAPDYDNTAQLMPAGWVERTFDFYVSGPAAGSEAQSVRIYYEGSSVTAPLTVYAAPRVQSLLPAPLQPTAGTPFELTIRLEEPAPPGGAEVWLHSTPLGLSSLQPPVVIPEGADTHVVTVSVPTRSTPLSVLVTSITRTGSQSVEFLVQPPA